MTNNSPWLQDTQHDTALELAEKQAANLAGVQKPLKRIKKRQPEGKLTQPPGKRKMVRCLAGCVSARAASMAQLGDLIRFMNCAQVPHCHAR